MSHRAIEDTPCSAGNSYSAQYLTVEKTQHVILVIDLSFV